MLQFQEIRQAPNFEHLHSFSEKNSFHATKHPNIYLIFFDTLRPDLALQYGDGIKSFYDHGLSFHDAYSTSTATWYATYSLFHGSPAFLAYNSVPHALKDPVEYGSIYLKILNKLGYKVNVYGSYWNCVNDEITSGSTWNRFLISFFGWKTHLLERCHHDLSYDDKFHVNQDQVTVEELERQLPKTVSTSSGNFSMLTFYNNHVPYKWDAVTHGASKDVGDHDDNSNKTQYFNRYVNSVKGSNINFKRLLKLIQSLPGHDEAVIVLFSDHGEMLFEKYGAVEHGGVPYKERSKILLSFQFTHRSLFRKLSKNQSLASISDIFPTLFDYIGVLPSIPKEWVIGQSLISTTRQSVLLAQTAGEFPTRNMVLVNKDMKAWFTIDDEDFYHSNSLHLTYVTDPDDKPAAKPHDFCTDKSDEDCKALLFATFPEGMAELYSR